MANSVCHLSVLGYMFPVLRSKHQFSNILPGFVHHHFSFVWLETRELLCFGGLTLNPTDCAISSGSVWTYCRDAEAHCNDGVCEQNVKLTLWGGREGYFSSFEEGLSSESVWQKKTEFSPLRQLRVFCPAVRPELKDSMKMVVPTGDHWRLER